MKALVAGALLVVVAGAAIAQGTVRGHVRNARSNEPVAGATVLVVGTRTGAITDTAGAYEIAGVAAGAVRIRVRFIGYADAEQPLTVQDGEVRVLNFQLTESITTLGAVRTEAKANERELFEDRPNLGVTLLNAKVVSTIPRLGEADVLRAAQMLPGVLARNDFSAGLNVRGGEADQNLILLDGYPIFNPFHLGGLFGTFIDGSIDGLELRTGGFPAPFGGRLSSVLDVKSAEETRTGIHGSGTLSMLATSGAVGSMFGDGKGTWMVAGRRTYADKVLSLFRDVDQPYWFRDGVAHATYRPLSRTRLSTTLYDGRDELRGDLATANDAAGGGNFLFFWGNRVVGLTVDQQLTDSLRAQQRVSYTFFRTVLDLGDTESGLSSLRLNNQVREQNINGLVEWRRGVHRPSIGYDLTRDDLVYTAGSQSAAIEFLRDVQQATSAAAYVNDVWRPSDRLVMEGGLRYEWLKGSGWSALSPRLAAKYFATPNVALTGAVGRHSQWLHSLSREDIPVRLFDFWTASDTATPVSRATHFVGGTESWFGTSRFIRLEGYFKKYDRLLEPNTADDPNVHGDEHLQLSGHSYGLDLLARQLERGKWGGWLAYTYTFSSRDGPNGRFFPGQDRRNNVNLLVSYRKSPKTLISTRFGYATGNPYTDIVAQIPRLYYDPANGRWESQKRTDDIQPIGGPRNANRLPATHRFDVTVTREMRKGVSFTPFLSVINLYNAKNVFMYSFDYEGTPPTRTAFSQLPILPSLGLTVTW